MTSRAERRPEPSTRIASYTMATDLLDVPAGLAPAFRGLTKVRGCRLTESSGRTEAGPGPVRRGPDGQSPVDVASPPADFLPLGTADGAAFFLLFRSSCSSCSFLLFLLFPSTTRAESQDQRCAATSWYIEVVWEFGVDEHTVAEGRG